MRLISIALVIVAAFSIAVLGQDQELSTDVGTEQGVHKAAGGFVEAFNDLDWNRFHGMFASDATVFFPWGGPREDWKKGGSARFKSMFDAIRERDKEKSPPYLSIAPKDVQIQMAGDVAIMTFHLGEGGSSRRTIAWHKRHGKWLILHLHASNIVPPSDTDR